MPDQEHPRYKIAVSNMAFKSKLLPGDPIWSKFNSSFENKELETQNLMQAIYDGFPITTWHKDHWRHGDNFICGMHLGLDFDGGGATLESLIKDVFVVKYGAFIYTTMSHTEENPRCRVIFMLDQPIQQAKNYGMAAAALLWMFGTADRACKDPARFWYGSPGCDFEYLDNVLPLDVVKRMIANYVETGGEHKKKATTTYHAPVDQQEVADALRLIPPWQIDYTDWLAVLMAIHSQFGDSGLGLAESWGDGKGDEIKRKFNSFEVEGNGSGAVTIASLFGIAKRFGWKKSSIQEGSFAV